MVGRTLGRFEIKEKLGEGGMGVVYRAFDTRLNRTVALKVLPPAALADAERKQRFVQEAIAASALNHPHIVTTYDIDRIDDVDFIAMEFVDGQSLDRAISHGRLPIDQVIDYGMQLADAVAAAHQVGIVHRDIKPGNVMRNVSGRLKVLDFGLAKLIDSPGATDAATVTGRRGTTTGAIVGTAAYMSPEQAEGKRITPAADVFAIGVVLYELTTGVRPFRGDSEIAVLASLLRDEPSPVTALRPETPPALAAVIAKCLQKDPDERYANGAALHAALSALRHGAELTPASRRALGFAAIAVIAMVLAASGLAWWSLRESQGREASRRGLADVDQLMARERPVAAYQRFREISNALPDDLEVRAVGERILQPASIVTDPPGALIEIQEYSEPESSWERLGETPLKDIVLPMGYLRLRATKPGYEPRIVAYSFLNPPFALTLHAPGTRPAGMVFVPGGPYQYGAAPSVSLAPYWIDEFEVTNAQFKTFVDAGGYRNRAWWKQAFVRDGREIPWEEAIAAFVDSTGRLGPATWELGTFPEGKGEEPVGGVSWYEAAAYAAFAGKLLPSVYHWYQAAGLGGNAAYPAIVRVSNFNGKGPAKVGSHGGLSLHGTFDMAGNVKEWCSNEVNGRRHIAGGAWSEPVYMFTDADAQSPFERSATYGFRLVKPATGTASYNTPEHAALNRVVRDVARETRVSDEAFAVIKALYAYDRTPLNAKVEQTETTAWWRKETVSYAAAYGGERMTVYLYLPLESSPPYQAVVHFPGSYATVFESSRNFRFELQFFDFIVRSGRAVVFPIYKGTYERRIQGPTGPNAVRDLRVAWFKDVARTLDYVESRNDIDSTKLAYYGLSMGASEAPIMAALEPRFKAIIAIAGGFQPLERLPEVEPANFAPRVKKPFLMINGKQDFMRPYETSQLPMFNMLGTPPSDKKLASYDGGHLPQRLPMIKETLDWLDRYLGPVR